MPYSNTTVHMLEGDANIAEHAARARANVNALRRFEKDYFINVGDATKEAQYLKEWTDERDSVTARLNDLEKYADKTDEAKEDKERVRVMRTELAAYIVGFNKVSSSMQAGTIKTTQQANAAINEYKDSIHKLEAEAKSFAEHGNKRMEEAVPLIESTTNRTTWVMMLISVIAVLISVMRRHRDHPQHHRAGGCRCRRGKEAFRRRPECRHQSGQQG